MKLIVFSDLHVHAWDEHSQDWAGVPSRLAHCVSVLRRVRAYATEHGIRFVLFGGDLFHKRGVLYTLPYNLVCAELAEWKRAGLELIANVGNHDAADRRAKVHALQALESAGLLHTVGPEGWGDCIVRAHEEDAHDVTVSLVAYCPEADELRRRTDAALEHRLKEGWAEGAFCVGLFHHGFKGARVGTSLEYQVKESADPDLYASSFSVMFSGHYHAHQTIGSLENAWYVGSPMEFVRGETSPKGFLVLDTGQAEFERVDLDLPRFVKLHDHEIVDPDFDVREHVRGNYVDVVFEELPMPWEKVEETLLNLGACGVKACPTRDVELSKSSRLQVDPTMGDRQLLESYMDYAKVDPEERDELLRKGLELVEAGAK